MKTKTTVGMWVLIGILACIFLGVGVGKLMGGEMLVESYENWGYAGWFVYVIGAFEVAGVIGLFIPKLRMWAALGLIGIMVGAVGTHLLAGEWGPAVVPVVLIGMLAALMYMGKKSMKQEVTK